MTLETQFPKEIHKLIDVDMEQPRSQSRGVEGASESEFHDYRESLKQEWGLSSVTGDFANLGQYKWCCEFGKLHKKVLFKFLKNIEQCI